MKFGGFHKVFHVIPWYQLHVGWSKQRSLKRLSYEFDPSHRELVCTGLYHCLETIPAREKKWFLMWSSMHAREKDWCVSTLMVLSKEPLYSFSSNSKTARLVTPLECSWISYMRWRLVPVTDHTFKAKQTHRCQNRSKKLRWMLYLLPVQTHNIALWHKLSKTKVVNGQCKSMERFKYEKASWYMNLWRVSVPTSSWL